MAKYITKDGLKFLDKMVERDVELEIGMGFECENDVVRNVCVNKGERIGDYRRAVGLLKEKGIRSLAYVLLKPPFLSEGEAVEEAISTIKMAREIGFDAISLEPLSIHAFTLVHALSTEGLYQLPWLWSVVKVAQSAKWIPDFRIGGAGFYPRPINVASNKHPDRKDGCNKRLWTAIRKYGKTRNLALFKGLDCVCREEWDKECQRSAEPLRDRIREQLRRLDIDRYASFVSGQGLVMQPSVKFAEGVAGGTQYRRD